MLGGCARTVLPRSRHTAANDDAVRLLEPVDTIREVRESSRRAVVHARLLGASHRRGCSSQKDSKRGGDTGSRWIQTLSYNSRNGGTLLTLFADCRLVSRIFSPRCLCVARCFGKNLSGAPFQLPGCPWKFTITHARPHRRRSSLALGRARGEHAGSYPSGEGSNGGKARG